MIASRYYMAGDNGESKKLLESALALVRNSQDVELRASLICRRAMTVADLGQTSEAARAIIDELKRLQSNTEVASDCLQYRAHIAVLEGDAAGAMRYATLALEHHRKAPHTSVSSEAYLLAAVATGHELNGRNGRRRNLSTGLGKNWPKRVVSRILALARSEIIGRILAFAPAHRGARSNSTIRPYAWS